MFTEQTFAILQLRFTPGERVIVRCLKSMKSIYVESFIFNTMLVSSLLLKFSFFFFVSKMAILFRTTHHGKNIPQYTRKKDRRNFIANETMTPVI